MKIHIELAQTEVDFLIELCRSNTSLASGIANAIADKISAQLVDETTDEERDFQDDEPHGSYDLSDDGDALASAGHGTDEDYGYYGQESDFDY